MNYNTDKENEKSSLVIPDECGDTMWDAVLAQEGRVCEVSKKSQDSPSLYPAKLKELVAGKAAR